uniref:Medium-chain acyl-CoA ligase ACSF2, mitochondrial n=1 Tax=Bursaphelenchus xylophilus TaxID=6326 RepID=A0A1I7SL82_BURXY
MSCPQLSYGLRRFGERPPYLRRTLGKQNVLVKIWNTPHVRRALILGCSLQYFNQLAGINTIMYYTGTIIKSTGVRDNHEAIWLSCITSFFNFAANLLPFFIVERFGRRPVILSSMVAVTVSLCLMAISFMMVNRDTLPTMSPAQMEQITGAHPHLNLADPHVQKCLAFTNCDFCVTDDSCGFCGATAFANEGGVCLPLDELHSDIRSADGFCSSEAPSFMHNVSGVEFEWTDVFCENKYTMLPLILMVIYLISFSSGLSPMPWVLNAEFYPIWARGMCVSLSTFSNWIANLAVSMTYLTLTTTITRYGTFFLYAAITAFGFVIAYFYVPETKNHSLDEVETLFMTQEERLRHKTSLQNLQTPKVSQQVDSPPNYSNFPKFSCPFLVSNRTSLLSYHPSQLVVVSGRRADRLSSPMLLSKKLPVLSNLRALRSLRLKHTAADGSKLMSYVHQTSDIPLMHKTIGQQVREFTEKHPDKELFVFKEQNISKTYQEVYNDARKLALGLIHLGIKRGDRVGIWGPNYYEWTVAQYGAALAGIVLVNVNPAYQTEEFRYAMRKVGVKALITPPRFRKTNYYDIICGLSHDQKKAPKGMGIVQSQALPDLKHLIMFDPDNPNHESFNGAWNFRDILCSGGSEAEDYLEFCQRRTRPDDPANIQYTSGTTGIQKAATITHFGMLNAAHFTGVLMGYDQNTKLCLPNPLFHCFGCVIGTLTVPMLGGGVYFPASWFNAAKVAEMIQEHKCTALYGTPTMFVDVLNHAKINKLDISSAKKGVIGGSPCPITLCQQLVEAGMTELCPCYGTTEMSSAVTLARYQDDPLERVKNVGYVLPHSEIAIMDNRGRVVPRGEQGEIWVRSFGVMRHYYDEPGETAKAISEDRWYHTGDMGYMNDDGAVVISGRLREMIIRGGENIYPAEIEQFLFKHPSILNAYVVGIPDERWGEEVCAVIRLREGEKPLSEQDVKDFCRGKISHYKVPQYVLFKDESFIPMTPSGKVRKFMLTESCRKELGKDKKSAFD